LTAAEIYEEVNLIFLAAMASGLTISQSAQKAGKSVSCFLQRKKHDQNFAAAWAEAGQVATQFAEGARQKFLHLLAEGLGVSSAARLVGRSLWRLTEDRRQEPDFDQAWKNAYAAGRAKKLARLQSLDLAPFLRALSSGQSVAQAATMVGLTVSALYYFKNNDTQFAIQWAEAMATKKSLAINQASKN
jgi:hypothetical protein